MPPDCGSGFPSPERAAGRRWLYSPGRRRFIRAQPRMRKGSVAALPIASSSAAFALALLISEAALNVLAASGHSRAAALNAPALIPNQTAFRISSNR